MRLEIKMCFAESGKKRCYARPPSALVLSFGSRPELFEKYHLIHNEVRTLLLGTMKGITSPFSTSPRDFMLH